MDPLSLAPGPPDGGARALPFGPDGIHCLRDVHVMGKAAVRARGRCQQFLERQSRRAGRVTEDTRAEGADAERLLIRRRNRRVSLAETPVMMGYPGAIRLTKFDEITPPTENRFHIDCCCLGLLDSRFRGNDGRQDWNDGRQDWNDGRQPFKTRLPCRLTRTEFVIARSDATRRSRWPRGVPCPNGIAALRSQ